ncbi:hypothetical protein ABVT39_010487 [Epinephelus coioides]
MMSQLPQGTADKQQPLAYWLQLTPEDSHLKQKWTEWERWIRMHYDTAHTPTLPLHCTLMYDRDQTHVDYQECWDAGINKKPYLITSEDIFGAGGHGSGCPPTGKIIWMVSSTKVYAAHHAFSGQRL